MSKSDKRARWEAEAKARAEAAPSAPPSVAPVAEADAEPELPTSLEVAEDAPPPAEDEASADTAPVARVADFVGVQAAPVTFAPDGSRYADKAEAAGSVRCEALANLLWRGTTVAAGSALMVPPDAVDRLVKKQLIKRL